MLNEANDHIFLPIIAIIPNKECWGILKKTAIRSGELAIF